MDTLFVCSRCLRPKNEREITQIISENGARIFCTECAPEVLAQNQRYRILSGAAAQRMSPINSDIFWTEERKKAWETFVEEQKAPDKKAAEEQYKKNPFSLGMFFSQDKPKPDKPKEEGEST